jgi:hypothetical protein
VSLAQAEVEQLREKLATQTQLATEIGTQLSAARTQADNRLAELGNQTAQLKAELQAAKAKAAVTPLPIVNPALEQENDLLLAQLHQVQEELERYYFENQALKVKAAPATLKTPSKPVHYGAADRVKGQLSYRLGATMVERSRSFGGWLGMPLALAREARQFKREKIQRGSEKLPPIAHYRDAHAAERIKLHLSYRLGQTLVANARSPIGWVKLPWVLWRQVRDFRASKQRLPA